jgi:hypothetical protein
MNETAVKKAGVYSPPLVVELVAESIETTAAVVSQDRQFEAETHQVRASGPWSHDNIILYKESLKINTTLLASKPRFPTQANLLYAALIHRR